MLIVAFWIGVLAGYVACTFATWNRTHQQESHLRRLSNDIAVMVDMGDTVPPEWVRDQLETMIAKDYR